MNKTIFITGASTGLGKAAAKLFQAKGWKVIATMRNPSEEKELNLLSNVWLLPLDVSNPDQINKTVSEAQAISPVDVVFNNAGYGLMGSLEGTTDEKIVKQINTNLLGVIRVTKAFIPHFREKRSGLFISTTSMGGFMGFPLHSIYHATKFGIEGWSESMSFELKPHNIFIKTVAPGGTKTDFLSRSLDLNRNENYTALEDKLIAATENMMDAAIPASEVAEVVYAAATDGKEQLRYIAGKDANASFARRTKIGAEAFHKELAAQFIDK